MGFPFAFKLAAQSIAHEKWINLLSILTIAAGLLFSSLTLLAVYNIDSLTKKLPEKFSVMLYLNDNLSQQGIKAIITKAESHQSVEKAVFISKEKALKDLQTTFKNTEYIFHDIGENPLPDTIELKFAPSAVSPENVKKITQSLKGAPGINEIEYGERFLSSIHSIQLGVKTVGMIFVILMNAGLIFVCYSTVKILFYRKEHEIETYKLLGAKRNFIRAPFIIEGAVIGLIGGLICFIGAFALYYLIVLKLSMTLPLFKTIIFPVQMIYLLPVAGLFLGITGAFFAIGRIKY